MERQIFFPQLVEGESMAISVSLSSHLHLHGCHFAPSLFRFRTPGSRRAKCSISFSSCSHSDEQLESSWISREKSDDGFQGWSAGQQPDIFPVRKGIRKLVLAGIGSSVLILLISLTHFSFTRKGIKLQLTSHFQPLVDIFRLSKPANYLKEGIETVEVAETIAEDKHLLTKDVSVQTKNDQSSGKRKYKTVPAIADSTQQEALSLLQKLKERIC